MPDFDFSKDLVISGSALLGFIIVLTFYVLIVRWKIKRLKNPAN
jgi:hypothetical protein